MNHLLVEQALLLALLSLFAGFWTAFNLSFSRFSDDGKLSALNLVLNGVVPTLVILLGISSTPMPMSISAPFTNVGVLCGLTFILGMGIEILLRELVLWVTNNMEKEKALFYVKGFALLIMLAAIIMVLSEAVLILGYLNPTTSLEVKVGILTFYVFVTGLLVRWYTKEYSAG